MSRIVTLVLVDTAGAVLGALPPFEVATPWWQEVPSVLAGARDLYGVEVTLLRLLATELPSPPGGAVIYLAECPGAPPGPAVPVDAAAFDLAPHPLRAAWARPGGPAASLAWAAGQLAELGWRPAVASQQRSWNLSGIWRLDSPSGVAWLKQVPPFFGHEATVLRWLAGVAAEHVPTLLAADRDGGRMLIEHAPGEDLYAATPAERGQLLDDLHLIQRRALTDLEPLRTAGVPDNRWPALAQAIRRTAARYGGELAPASRPALESLVDTLDERFAAIDACGLPDTLGHGDFHAGNARGDGVHRTLIDWGDSFVGHPGFDALRLVENRPPDVTGQLLGHWSARWRETAPGSDPQRALHLLGPVAALRAAVSYADFVAAIEPSECAYHASDVGFWLSTAAGVQ